MTDLIVEPAQFGAYLFRLSLLHDELVVKDAVTNTWQISEDELQRFWAASISIKNGSVNPTIVPATLPWFMTVRPLAVPYAGVVTWLQ